MADIKASTAVNVEAEGKLAHMSDEMQGLVRTLKAKEQAIQESAVRIELMERRMEAVKKQADTIADLEGELSNAKKQKRVYEEAMEQLQADLDALEQDNAKLKAMTTVQERHGALCLSVCGIVGVLTRGTWEQHLAISMSKRNLCRSRVVWRRRIFWIR